MSLMGAREGRGRKEERELKRTCRLDLLLVDPSVGLDRFGRSLESRERKQMKKVSSVWLVKKDGKSELDVEGRRLTVLLLPLPPHFPISLCSLPLSNLPRVPRSTLSRLVRISGAVPLPVVSSFPLSPAAAPLPGRLFCFFPLLPL